MACATSAASSGGTAGASAGMRASSAITGQGANNLSSAPRPTSEPRLESVGGRGAGPESFRTSHSRRSASSSDINTILHRVYSKPVTCGHLDPPTRGQRVKKALPRGPAQVPPEGAGMSTFGALVEAPLWLAAAWLLPPQVIVLCETIGALLPLRKEKPPAAAARALRTAVLLPAHNVGAQIEEPVRALGSQLRVGDRLIVIADNCSDDTAALARSAGATEVIERDDSERRGKGFAI